MAFTREKELAAEIGIVLALSVEAGITLERTRKHICAIGSICPLFEGTGRHWQWDDFATSNRSRGLGIRATVDTATAWAVLEQLVDFLGGHTNVSKGVAIDLTVMFTRETEGRCIIGIIDAVFGFASGRSDGEGGRQAEETSKLHFR